MARFGRHLAEFLFDHFGGNGVGVRSVFQHGNAVLIGFRDFSGACGRIVGIDVKAIDPVSGFRVNPARDDALFDDFRRQRQACPRDLFGIGHMIHFDVIFRREAV